MFVYGVAILAACTLAGLYLGDLLGAALGLEANVGGVGIAMLLLVAISTMRKGGLAPESPSAGGVQFWSLMYIPIIVAMAAKQNVVAAAHGGPLAITAGVMATLACFALVPVMSRLAQR